MTIFKSWFLNTTVHQAWGRMDGPFDPTRLMFGHGIDTFLPLFPLYKHDPNPFGQAHNDWLQIPWEVGAIGAGAVGAYVTSLMWRLYCSEYFEELAGCVIIGVNMFFCFPMRMTQTMLLIVAWLAYCERQVR